MKYAGKIQFFVNIIFTFIAGFFFFSCGLEEVFVIDPPVTNYNTNALFSSSNSIDWYFDFSTREQGQVEEFIGTEIYYKIYNNSSDLTSERNYINSVNYEANGSLAAKTMIESYSYQTLGRSAGGGIVFVPAAGTNRRVTIRLKDYEPAFSNGASGNLTSPYLTTACISINGAYENAIPMRLGTTKSFDFFDDKSIRQNSANSRNEALLPKESDSDYKYSSSSEVDSDKYYVQMFAVGVAWNSSEASRTYSLVLDLGSVPIIKGE